MQAAWEVDPAGAVELVGQPAQVPAPVVASTDQYLSAGHLHAEASASEVEPVGQAAQTPLTAFL